MKTIIHLLKTTNERYNDIRFQSYITWCEAYGKAPARMQALLSNQQTYNWFSNEYRKLELLFLEKVNPAHRTGEIRTFYADITNKILMLYPSPLLKRVQKLKISTTNYN